MTIARELVAKVEQAQGCDLSLLGAPRLDDLTGRWLVAYSGVGPACDDLGAALQREGSEAEISFYRRPNDDELMAVTWSGLNEWRVARSAITSVDSSSDDPEAVSKATILVTYGIGGEETATASFRLKDPVPWLTELGYDWGPEGPPAED